MKSTSGVRIAQSRRSRSGQSLIVAVVALFVLLFLGGVFVGMISSNLLNTGRARDTVSAYALAEAGARYASEFLENSPEGADWRPAPTPLLDTRDPDRRWLETGEYTRLMLDKGRALIRVSMKPDPADPNGKYIDIESVGRSGVLDPTDPTTYVSSPAPRLSRTIRAKKAIGITDYLRYVTNRDRESKFEATLGVPPIGVPLWMQLGGLPVRSLGGSPSFPTPGAPIRVNGDLRLLPNVTLAVNPANHESVLVAGKVKVASEVAGDAAQQSPRFRNLAAAPGNVDPSGLPAIIPSESSQYSTFGGLLRDDSPAPDNNVASSGYTRSISALPPPSLEAVDQSTGVNRYRLSTRDSGLWIRRKRDNRYVNTGRFGLGAGLYVDNTSSTEKQSQAIDGGQSLRSLWLKPGSNYWMGPYYIPPGAYVELGYQVVQDQASDGTPVAGQYVSQPGFRVVRDAADRLWRDPNGVVSTREQAFTYFIYKPVGQKPVVKLDNAFFRAFLRSDQGMSDAEIDRFLPAFNGVVYAEGNVRVRGLLPNLANLPVRVQSGDIDNLSVAEIRARVNAPALTIVSGACIYIEGSIVRERGGAESGSAGSMLALLAKDYVVVNTTMFVSANKGTMPFVASNDDEAAPFHTNITVEEAGQAPPFSLSFQFGDDPTQYTSDGGYNGLQLLTRHGAPVGVTYMNLLINEAFPLPGQSPMYEFNALANAPFVYPMSNGSLQGADLFEQRAFSLAGGGTYRLFTTPGAVNTLRPSVDPNYTSGQGTQDYLFSRMAVAPLDVRIEAVLYAQNGSFFIIPGYPLNTNPADTELAARRNAEANGAAAGSMLRPAGTADVFPFYSQPTDIRITVVGAVSENRTASVSDQAAWMQLWGYIPAVYGSTDAAGQTAATPPREHLFVTETGMSVDYRANVERSAKITRGLRFLYDPALMAPYVGYSPGGGAFTRAPGGWVNYTGGAFRQDEHGRTLPPLPRLPVCPGFVFFGEA
jgi:hypothetical protein